MKDNFLRDLDECVCGDPRKDHKNKKGSCRYNGGLGHGFGPPCKQFKFAMRCRDNDLKNEGL